jgi:hypothetical protein
VHKRGNESWSIGCDLLCNHCNDVMPYPSLMSCLTHWLDHSPSTVRLQYPIPQPFVRPHHCRAESDIIPASTITTQLQSSHIDPLMICGCVADSSDLSRFSTTQTQVQCIARRSRDHDRHIPTGMRRGSSIRQRSERDRDVREGPWKSWDFRPRLPTGFTTITTSTSATDSGKYCRQLPESGLNREVLPRRDVTLAKCDSHTPRY